MIVCELRIATRASNLALWQANFVADLLRSPGPRSGSRAGPRHHDGRPGPRCFAHSPGRRRRLHPRNPARPARQPGRRGRPQFEGPADGTGRRPVVGRRPQAGLAVGRVGPAGRFAPLIDGNPRSAEGLMRASEREASAAGRSSFCFYVPTWSFWTSAATSRHGSASSMKERATRLLLAEAGLDRLGLSPRISARLGSAGALSRQWGREPSVWNVSPMKQRCDREWNA